MTPLGTEDPRSIGDYTLLGRLGAGGMGVVYLGVSPSGRQVAVKFVHGPYAQEEEFRTRFRQEVAAARRVSGAFTAPVVDADPDADRPWMATLYVPGPTLAEVVKKDGPLSPRELRGLGLGLTEALRDIHRAGLVHRDLKPANVLMCEDGPRVIDFGISRTSDSQKLTMTGQMMGTPPFMSPEQLASPRDVTPASDVFSLGSLLVFAAVGTGPFDADSPYMTGYQVMYETPDLEGVPEALLDIVERCLDKDPAARLELADLHRMLQALPESDAPAPAQARDSANRRPRPAPRNAGTTSATVAPGTRRRRRARTLLTVVGAALAVTGLFVGGSVYVLGRHTATASHTAPTPTASRTTATARAASLPGGWRPWKTNLRYDVKGVGLDYDSTGCVAAGTALFCGGTGFTVARVDAASGRVLWRSGTRPQNARPIGVRDGLVYAYEVRDSGTRRVVALDAGTGHQRWQHDISTTQEAVLYDGGLLTMSTDSAFVVYGPSGKELWEAPSLDEYCTASALGGASYALCSAGTEPGKGPVDLEKLGPGSLTEIATLPTGAEALGVFGGQPVFLAPQTTKEVYEAGYERPYNAILRVDLETGRVRRIALAHPLTGTATLVDGVVYFVRSNGSVTAVSADSGRQLWQKATDMEYLSVPAVSAAYKRVYFSNRFGRLLALDSRTGGEVWRTPALDDTGDKAVNIPPSVLLVKDAIVATAGDTAFSRSPGGPAS
ncbi:PQQ-binding-like beta-propeller repeat protein [Streptomyces cocklensis]|uniref:Non-specific serine/threonine protein kinase n=1 Tax=Actinacidiphila cocklensis TaxID=887465 RepID=A0A9W4DX78_9ACTN|nr:serine/threonine-protein kinase [Actinacidiphila cocklensis]MDD1056708.1 PQQ-binding-like beta-propeller repeat protein [Actinacidiphila cocklensis]CAG6397820.1 Non-specific serine/threonine protein kinase [Actinacidiphila cocklensis]